MQTNLTFKEASYQFSLHRTDAKPLGCFEFENKKNGSPESGSRSWRVELNLIQTRQVCTERGTATGSA